MQQSLSHLVGHIRKFGFSQQLLYLVSFMLFFWALFDGILGYMVPVVITSAGLSKTEMGLIFGFSSVAGAVFDFLLSKYLKSTHFRRIYFIMFACCFVYPLLLWQAKGVWLYLLAMSLWGLYYDLENFGNYDFVGRKAAEEQHAAHFGVIWVFKSLAYLLAPLLAGILIGNVVTLKPFLFSWLLIGISFIFFIALFIVTTKRRDEREKIKEIKPINVFKEIHLWQEIGKILLPVLILTMLLNVLDAFFWTIGPIISQGLLNFHPFDGLFVAAYVFPGLFVGWIVGKVTQIFGKKRTAFTSLLIGSLVILFLPLFTHPGAIIGLVLVASTFFALAWPSINGAYADYISETTKYEKEIEGLEDFSTNIGYIVGPSLAGFLADRAGNLLAFSFLGGFCIMACIILIIATPRSITIKI